MSKKHEQAAKLVAAHDAYIKIDTAVRSLQKENFLVVEFASGFRGHGRDAGIETDEASKIATEAVLAACEQKRQEAVADCIALGLMSHGGEWL